MLQPAVMANRLLAGMQGVLQRCGPAPLKVLLGAVDSLSSVNRVWFAQKGVLGGGLVVGGAGVVLGGLVGAGVVGAGVLGTGAAHRQAGQSSEAGPLRQRGPRKAGCRTHWG